MISLPGMPHHQAVLEAIVRYYAVDPRIRAVLLFGSLAEGTWDQYSDLDLDIVVQDAVQLEVSDELARLSSTLEPGALIIARGDDEGDVVLPSLVEFSVRYHVLADTNPNILPTARVIHGALDRATLENAGLLNLRKRNTEGAATKVNAFLRYALETDSALRRGRLWLALDLLSRLRLIGMELFALDRGAHRPVHAFDELADPALQLQFAALLPSLDASSIRAALLSALDLLPTLPGVDLTNDQRAMHERIRQHISEAPTR